MELLNEYWNYFEDIGIPIIMTILVITLFSLNFYASECSEMNAMKIEIDKNGNLNKFKDLGYSRSDYSYPFHLLSIFSFLPGSNSKYYEHKKFSNKVNIIKTYRKFYLIIFLTIIPLLIVGVYINETFMS